MAVASSSMATRPSRSCRDGQADLIAVGREILNNPNWPMDAALKLGVDGRSATCRRSRLLARHPRQARFRHPALDLAERVAGG